MCLGTVVRYLYPIFYEKLFTYTDVAFEGMLPVPDEASFPDFIAAGLAWSQKLNSTPYFKISEVNLSVLLGDTFQSPFQ
jgi:hypothetical protein